MPSGIEIDFRVDTLALRWLLLCAALLFYPPNFGKLINNQIRSLGSGENNSIVLIKNYGRISDCYKPWIERGLEKETRSSGDHEPLDFEESLDQWYVHDDNDKPIMARLQVRIILVQVSNPKDIQIQGNPRVTHVIFVDPAPSTLTTLLMMPWEYVVGKAFTFQRWAFPSYPDLFGERRPTYLPSKYLGQLKEKPTSAYDFITRFHQMLYEPLPIRDYYCAATRHRDDEQYRKIARSLVMLGVVLTFSIIILVKRLKLLWKKLQDHRRGLPPQ